MPNVQAPDGTVIAFPDTMPSADISAAMQKHFPVGGTGHSDPSYWGDLKSGLHDLGNSASSGLSVAGAGMTALGLPEMGQTAQGLAQSFADITPNAPPGPSASARLAENLRQGNYRQALTSDLPHAIVSSLPSTMPIIAGGKLGGMKGAAAVTAAENAGPMITERAANNQHETPTLGDVAGAVPGIAANAAMGALIPGGAAKSITNPFLRTGARALLQGEAGAGMNLATQAGTTLGTDKGLSVDPYAVAGAGLTQGAMGAGLEGRGIVTKATADAVNNLTARTLPTPDLPTSQSVVRVTDAAKAIQAERSSAGQPMKDAAAFAAVKDSYVDNLNRAATELRASQSIDKADFNQLNNTIDAAKVGKNTITTRQLDHIDSLGLDDTTAAFIKENLTDLNTASSQSFLNQQTGPMAKIGNLAGKAVGIGGALATGNPMAITGALMGHRYEGKIGEAVGGMGDRLLGTSLPPVMLQRINAIRALKSAGIDPSNLQPAQMPGPNTPNSVTGNVPDATPVNTPIPAPQAQQPLPTPTGGANLPPLIPNTPSDVRSTLATDDMAGRAPQTAPQPLQGAPAPTLAGNPQAAPGGPLAGAMAYIARGLPHMTPDQVEALLRERLPPDEMNRLAQAPSVPAPVGKAYQDLIARAQAKATVANQGHAVEHSEQARVNARGYQASMDQAADQNPQFGNFLREIKMEKTVAGKQAVARAAIAANPAAAQAIQGWMLAQGKR
ncbi:MAG: hypothetical protein V4457_12795 [Pseudomonadota bacterium]